MTIHDFWLAFFLFGFAGFGAGFGLLIGSFVVRALRRVMKDDEEEGKHK